MMRRDQRSWRNHDMRIGKGDDGQQQQACANADDAKAGLHFQPQNRNTAMIWPVADTANASVIGTWTVRHFLTAS